MSTTVLDKERISPRGSGNTHILYAGSDVFRNFPNQENPPPAQDIKIQEDVDVRILEQFIGFKGGFSKILLTDERLPLSSEDRVKEYFVLDSNLQVLPYIAQNYFFINANEFDKPDSAIIPLNGDIEDRWDIVSSMVDRAKPLLAYLQKKVPVEATGEIFYSKKIDCFWCTVEMEYENENLSIDNEANLYAFARKAYIRGLQYIFKENNKKHSEEYITELSNRAYFFGEVQYWTMKPESSCSNLYFLVKFPARYIRSNEIVDYTKNIRAAYQDGLGEEDFVDPLIDPDQITKFTRIPFLGPKDFKEIIARLTNKINEYANLGQSFIMEECQSFIGAFSIDDYYRLSELKLSDEIKKFNSATNAGNFVETIVRLLSENNIDTTTEYAKRTGTSQEDNEYNKKLEIDNNIMFGFDEGYNIRYIDVVRGGKPKRLARNKGVFRKDFGNGGVIGSRCGFLLFNSPVIMYLNEPHGLKEVDYPKFVDYFIIPPPKPINYPKKSMDCVKDNIKKLAEDGLIDLYQTGKVTTQVIQFNSKKMDAIRSRGVLQSSADIYGDAISNVIKGTGDAIVQGIGEPAKSFFTDGDPNSTGGKLRKSGLDEIKKIFRRVDFQKALIARIICMIKDANNQGTLEGWDKFINPSVKKAVQDYLKNAFCTGGVNALVNIFATWKRPQFQALDVNAAMVRAIKDALTNVVAELWGQAIKDFIAMLGNCGDLNANGKSPEQALGVNQALEDLLNNNSPGYNAPEGLNEAYDAMGIPKNDTAVGASRADEQQKQQLKNLIADVTCLLSTLEVCQLMSEEFLPQQVYNIVKSLILRKYPNLSSKLNTPDEIKKFFFNLGKALNITDACKAITLQPQIRDICKLSEVDDLNRENLSQNLLSPEQINNLLAAVQADKQKRLDDLLKAIDSKGTPAPDALPILCRDGRGGKINPALVDETYLSQVTDVMDGSLKPIYKFFNDDCDALKINITQNKTFDFNADELKIFMSAGGGDEQRAALQNLLKEKGILAPDYILDENGQIKQPQTIKKDNEGNDIYKFNEAGLKQKEPSIAPVLSGNLTGRNDYFSQERIIGTSNNELTFRINTDNERAKYLAMIEIENARALTEKLKNSYTEKNAELVRMVTNELVSAFAEILVKLNAGTIADAEFWVGWAEIQESEGGGGWIEWTSRILFFCGEIIKLLDFFMADVINEPRKPLVQPRLLAGGDTWVYDEPPRYKQKRSSSQAVVIRDASDKFDQYMYEGNFIGSIDTSGGDTFAIIGTNARNDIATYTSAKEAKIAEIENYRQTQVGNFIDGLRRLEGEQEELENKIVPAEQQAGFIEEVYTEHKKGNFDMSVFDNIETVFSNAGKLMAAFENSVTFGTVIRIFTNISKIVQSIKDDVASIYDSIKSPIDLRNAAEVAYPNYQMTYEYGKKYEVTKNKTDSKIHIMYNNNSLTSLTGSVYGVTGSFIEFSEEIDKEALAYISRYKLDEGWTKDTLLSIQEYAFDKYKAIKGMAGSYRDIEKSFFDRLYSDVTSSIFFNTSYGIGGYVTNISLLDLKEPPTSDSDKVCGIENNGLDLDQLKEDMLNKFKDNACNHQPPDPLGRRRDLMNPVENVISDALMIATLRVYIYDYFTRAIFLADRYKLGMSATDPFVEILARYFETEMRSYSGVYYQNFIENLSSYHDKYYEESFRNLALKYTRDGINSKEAKNEKFKKIFAEQMMYVSKKINKKIHEAVNLMDANILSGVLKFTPIDTFNEVKRKFNYPSDEKRSFSQLLRFFENGKFVNYFGVEFERALPDKIRGRNPNEELKEQLDKTINGFRLKYGSITLLEGKVDLPPSEETDEFKFLFEFCFPIRKYIGLVAFHCILAGGAYPNTAKTFAITKGALKAKQNSLMDAKGILDTTQDPAAVLAKEGEATSEPNPWQEILMRILIKIPRQTLKNLCEIADPNVFLASLPYNIMRLFTVPFINQIPHIPISQNMSFLGISGVPEGLEDVPQNHKIGLFWTTPVVGLGVLPWTGLLPTPFGVLYYLFGLWTDDFLPEKPASVEQSLLPATEDPNSELCQRAREFRDKKNPKMDASSLYNSQYK